MTVNNIKKFIESLMNCNLTYNILYNKNYVIIILKFKALLYKINLCVLFYFLNFNDFSN